MYLWPGHIIMMRNKDENARLAAKRVLHYFPRYSIGWDRKASSYQNPDHLQQQHDDFKKAGIK